MHDALPFFVLAVPCLALWALFAGMEAGVFSLSRWRIRQQMRQGRRRAALLNSYMDHPERFFWTILVGNTVASFACVALVAQGIRHAFPPTTAAFWAAFAGAIYLLYLFGELLPKTLFRQFPNRLSMFAAVPFRSVHLLLSPAIILIERFARFMLRYTGGKMFMGQLFGSREELRSVMQDSAQGLSIEERAMINRVLDLQTSPLRQLAMPLTSFPPLKRNSSVAEALRHYESSQQDLLPIWDEGARKIVAVLDIDDVLFSNIPDRGVELREFVRPALLLSQEMKVEQALRRMQRMGQRMAIVLGPHGREWGVVRVDDILKQIFGRVTL